MSTRTIYPLDANGEPILYHGQTPLPVPGVLVRRVESAKENQFTPQVDAEGFVTGGSSTREPGDFLAAMRKLPKIPLDRSDIVFPSPLWPADADGRGWSVLEVEQMQKQQQQQHHTKAA